jgi:hypothetical protein
MHRQTTRIEKEKKRTEGKKKKERGILYTVEPSLPVFVTQQTVGNLLLQCCRNLKTNKLSHWHYLLEASEE